MFDVFKKRSPPAASPTQPSAMGVEAIERAFALRYPGQAPKNWTHTGVLRMHDLTMPPTNPLDAVHVYDANTFWHFVTLGLSELYMQSGPKREWSGLGYELTFRLAKAKGETEPPTWPIKLMEALARAAFSKTEFGPGHTIRTGPIDGSDGGRIDALLLMLDPAFTMLETPNGKLVFLQLLGIENAVRERVSADGLVKVFEELARANPEFVTRVL